MDGLLAKQKSIIGNTRDKIFTDGEGFVYVHHIQSKLQSGEGLNVLTSKIGFPKTLISDNAGDRMGPQTKLQEYLCRCRITDKTTEPYSPC